YFAAIVRNRREPYFYRFWAMRILADMDRYVPEENLPKGAEVTLGVDELKLHGAIDPFSQITGQRIGNRGRQTLQWAANEGDDKAVVDGDVRVECPKCDTPAETWAELSGQFFKDDFGLNPGSLGAYYAQMLHTLYGENTVRVVQVGDVIRQEWAIPAFN